jgi:hypothetical protein
LALDPTLEPTADAGSDPTADAGAITETAPAVTRTPERTYSDSDMAALRRSEQARYERRLEQEREQIRAELSGTTEEQWRSRVEAELQASAKTRYAYEADTAISQMKAKYPKFEANAVAIGQVMDREGITNIPGWSASQMLDYAYRLWERDELVKVPPVDVEAIKKKARDEALVEYTTKKTAAAEKTPRVEGAGGGTPVISDTREKRAGKKGAFDAALEYVTKSKQASA